LARWGLEFIQIAVIPVVFFHLSFFFLNLASLYLLIVGVKDYFCTISHSVTHSHTREDSSGRGTGPFQRPLPDNIQHSQEAKRQTSMSPAEFEPAVPASEQPQNNALERAIIGVLTVMWLFCVP